jgi:hypothetical protein
MIYLFLGSYYCPERNWFALYRFCGISYLESVDSPYSDTTSFEAIVSKWQLLMNESELTRGAQSSGIKATTS